LCPVHDSEHPMDDPGTLVLHRLPGTTARLRDFAVVIDGIKTDRISENETNEYSLVPGRHVVELRIDWCGSQKAEVEIQSGHPVEVSCRLAPSGSWRIIFSRNSYVQILDSQTVKTSSGTDTEPIMRIAVTLIGGIAILVLHATIGFSTILFVAAIVAMFVAAMFIPLPNFGGTGGASEASGEHR
jgi:hypothetical protein